MSLMSKWKNIVPCLKNFHRWQAQLCRRWANRIADALAKWAPWTFTVIQNLPHSLTLFTFQGVKTERIKFQGNNRKNFSEETSFVSSSGV